MVTRKAIIIASPLKKGQRGYLPGVEADVDNYFSFLTSPIGGYWYPNEIQVLRNPTKASALKSINAINVDYVITIFSGHGATDVKTKRDYINLNSSEGIWISDLSTNAKRQLAIVDACNTFED